LADYNVALAAPALEKLSLYLELLLRWNRKVNLTGLKDPRTIVRRLFAESLYAANLIELKGWLVDIGSGAGFPGLALKLAAPSLRVTLIEARQKKCAFLKEVAQQCGFDRVEVVAELFQSWAARQTAKRRADLITTRAVDTSPQLLQSAQKLLLPGGRLVLFTSRALAARLTRTPGLSWLPFEAYPADESNGLQMAII
jgi:16S rRNA (guanine527-N7)-methyltransferase